MIQLYINNLKIVKLNNTPNNEMIARDFISTMTDRFFNEQIKNYTLPLKS
mgnify:CR=1 FL=1